MTQFTIIIPAGGASQRFGTGRSKLLETLNDAAVITHTVRAFASRRDVAGIVIAARDQDRAMFDSILPVKGSDPFLAAPIHFCPGGPSRAHSVQNALLSLPDSVEWIAVHDGARPLTSQPLIDRTFAAAVAHGAAVPAMQVTLTIKQATGPLPAPVIRTIPRQDLYAMQTPQAMRRADLIEAFNTCPIPLEQVTDDVQLLELADKPVWLVDGEAANLKITTTLDLIMAQQLVKSPQIQP